MSDVIELKQFEGQTITPKDDAIMYDLMIAGNGIITGCNLINLGAGKIKISAGRGVIKGRQFVVQEHILGVTLGQDKNVSGRIFIRMDLEDTEEPIKILHETASVLSDLTQNEDCNFTNGIYEIELATYTASATTVSNLKKTMPEIKNQNAIQRKILTENEYEKLTEKESTTIYYIVSGD